MCPNLGFGEQVGRSLALFRQAELGLGVCIPTNVHDRWKGAVRNMSRRDRMHSILCAGGLMCLLSAFLAPAVVHGLVATPTRGPLSTMPTVKSHVGPPQRRLVTRDVIKGVGAHAMKGDVLTVDYVGALYKNGKIFDSSWHRHEPFVFPLGRGEVIKGWERGIIGMRVGGRRELVIPPALAYGKMGSPPTVPPNSTLVYVVDLLAVESR